VVFAGDRRTSSNKRTWRISKARSESPLKAGGPPLRIGAGSATSFSPATQCGEMPPKARNDPNGKGSLGPSKRQPGRAPRSRARKDPASITATQKALPKPSQAPSRAASLASPSPKAGRADQPFGQALETLHKAKDRPSGGSQEMVGQAARGAVSRADWLSPRAGRLTARPSTRPSGRGVSGQPEDVAVDQGPGQQPADQQQPAGSTHPVAALPSRLAGETAWRSKGAALSSCRSSEIGEWGSGRWQSAQARPRSSSQ